MQARVATTADAADITRIMTAAFAHDPVWGWAFPNPAHMAAWWRFYIDGALRYPWVFLLPGSMAAAMWIPPGGTELSAADEARIEPILSDLLGARAGEVLETLSRFDAAHAHDEPYYYLSLLATDPAHRGQGLGIALLAETLARIDSEHLPAYLESTNPVNDARYQRQGFVPRGRFAVRDGGPVVTTMWRSAR